MEPLFLIGCDPEFMITDKEDNLRSALDIFRGRKKSPTKVKNGATLADNVNFEFNTTPAKNVIEFKEYIKDVLREASRQLPDDHKFEAISGAEFPKSELKNPEACEFGCEPDYNAWLNGDANQVPEGAASRSFRSAGGHIHVGMTEASKHVLDEFLDKIRFIKVMDATHGITSLLMDKTQGTDVRRQLYGKAGCFRDKFYGVEYRTIGNFWASNPKIVDIVYGLTEVAMKLRLEDKDKDLVAAIGQDNIINTINNSDVDSARKIFSEHLRAILPEELTKSIISVAKNASYNVHRNWKLNS